MRKNAQRVLSLILNTHDLLTALSLFWDREIKVVSPVNADDTQGHDGRGTAHHVHCDEDVTKELSEDPLATDQVRDADEGHNGQRHGQVRQCQRHDQVVGGLPQLLDKADRDDHEHVPADGGEREHHEHASDQDFLHAAIAQDLLPAARTVALHDERRTGGDCSRGRCCRLRRVLRDLQQPRRERL